VTVVDTNVLLRTGSPPFDQPRAPISVREEVLSDAGERRLEVSGTEFNEVDEEALEKAQKVSESINSPTSETDEEVVALALQMDEKLVSDDFAVQNLAAHLDVEFDGFMEDAVEERREWSIRCGDCGAGLERMSSCSRCGGEPERVTSKREPLRE
jgi:UPF0271 protein